MILRAPGLAGIRPAALLLSALAACGLPVPLGMALVFVIPALPSPADAWAMILGTLLMFSPVLSWIGFAVAAPLQWLLLRRGWYGYGSAAALGLGIGAALAGPLDTEAALWLGAPLLLAQRALLPRI